MGFSSQAVECARAICKNHYILPRREGSRKRVPDADAAAGFALLSQLSGVSYKCGRVFLDRPYILPLPVGGSRGGETGFPKVVPEGCPFSSFLFLPGQGDLWAMQYFSLTSPVNACLAFAPRKFLKYYSIYY